MALVPDSSLLKHGSEVKDSLGEKLGTVSETAEGYFKVNVHMARDYWLPIDVIANYAGDVVELRYPQDELGAYRQYSGIEHLPGAEPVLPQLVSLGRPVVAEHLHRPFGPVDLDRR